MTKNQRTAFVEERLRSLRQVWAIVYMLNDGREEALAAAIRENPNIDVEKSLLKDDYRLRLQAAGPGSWFVTTLPARSLGHVVHNRRKGDDAIIGRLAEGKRNGSGCAKR